MTSTACGQLGRCKLTSPGSTLNRIEIPYMLIRDESLWSSLHWVWSCMQWNAKLVHKKQWLRSVLNGTLDPVAALLTVLEYLLPGGSTFNFHSLTGTLHHHYPESFSPSASRGSKDKFQCELVSISTILLHTYADYIRMQITRGAWLW